LYGFLSELTFSVTKEQLFIQLVQQLTASELFYGHAVIDAEDEVMMVLMKVFAEDVTQILSSGELPISEANINQAQQLIDKRLATRLPMAYIIGTVNFADLVFLIDDRALVPRSPIAELILNQFKPYLDISQIKSVLDLCTGSGCIGISIAKHYANMQVAISDISTAALDLAKDNINKHKVNVKVIESDLFQAITAQYDLIVTNPPYVSDAEYQQLPMEYKQEPKLGLVSERDGLQIPVEIMLNAPQYLNLDGYLILEVGYSDGALSEAFKQIDFRWIDFLNGGQGVCVFSRKSLLEYQPYFKDFLSTA
jgi:ribosomal protein L3 glutamine methyltransferase